ncbi:MAG: hypothetical protein U0T02_02090 [Solirubrobacteraceae bacterium]
MSTPAHPSGRSGDLGDPSAAKHRLALWMATSGVVWSAVACVIGLSALVQRVDAAVVAVLMLPLCLALVAWWGLHRWCARSSRSARALARTAVVLLAAFAVISGFSVGMLFVPTVILLGAATVIAGRQEVL